MQVVRNLVIGIAAVCCTGFIPVGGCAKGCGGMSRAGRAAHGAEEIAHLGRASHYGDDLARGYGRTGAVADDLARSGRYRQVGSVHVGGAGHATEEVSHLSRASLDESVAALPEVEGGVDALARTPSSSGRVIDGVDGGRRTFGSDYARSIDDLHVTPKQHDDLLEVFESAQDLASNVVDLLSDDDDSNDEVPRTQLAAVAMEIDAELTTVLSAEQLQQFRHRFGSSEVVAYRLAKDRPIKRAQPSGKVAP
jgi:hypothetical protein